MTSEIRQGPGWWMDLEGMWNPPETWPESSPPLPGWVRGPDGKWSAPTAVTPAPVPDASTLNMFDLSKQPPILDLTDDAVEGRSVSAGAPETPNEATSGSAERTKGFGFADTPVNNAPVGDPQTSAPDNGSNDGQAPGWHAAQPEIPNVEMLNTQVPNGTNPGLAGRDVRSPAAERSAKLGWHGEPRASEPQAGELQAMPPREPRASGERPAHAGGFSFSAAQPAVEVENPGPTHQQRVFTAVAAAGIAAVIAGLIVLLLLL